MYSSDVKVADVGTKPKNFTIDHNGAEDKIKSDEFDADNSWIGQLKIRQKPSKTSVR